MAFDLSNVTSDNAKRAHCTVVHSPGGVGKTTFGVNACLAKNGLMILSEDGLSPLNIEGIPRVFVSRWGTLDKEGYKNDGYSFQDVLLSLMTKEHKHKVIVIDTMDALIPALDSYVVYKYYNGDIEKADAYKSKYLEYISEMSKVLKSFMVLQEKDIEVIVLIHSMIADHRDPSAENFKRWELNLPGGAKTSLADLLYNYADNCLFANYDVVVSDGKGSGNSRVAFTEWNAAYEAKNRYNLPYKFAFDKKDSYKIFTELIKSNKE